MTAPLRHARVRQFVLFVTVLMAATGVGLPPSGPVHADETIEQRYIVSIERIWDRPAHSAFTDLVEFNRALYCSFREGSDHIPGLNGVIRVIRSTDGANWQSVARLDERHVDLRDPKLSVTPDGRLMINMGASYYHGRERKRIESRWCCDWTRCWRIRARSPTARSPW